MGIQHKTHIEFLGSLNHSYVKKETSPNETTQIQSSPGCMCMCHNMYIIFVLFSFRSIHYHFTILIAMHFFAQITKNSTNNLWMIIRTIISLHSKVFIIILRKEKTKRWNTKQIKRCSLVFNYLNSLLMQLFLGVHLRYSCKIRIIDFKIYHYFQILSKAKKKAISIYGTPNSQK